MEKIEINIDELYALVKELKDLAQQMPQDTQQEAYNKHRLRLEANIFNKIIENNGITQRLRQVQILKEKNKMEKAFIEKQQLELNPPLSDEERFG